MEGKKEKQKVRRVRVLSQASFVFDRAKHGEVNNGVSETVPNEAMTIRQIFDRFRKGMPLGAEERQGGRFSLDGSDQDFDSPDFDKLKEADFVDRDEFQEQLMVQIADKQKVLKERRDQETKKRQEEEKEIQALREELRIRRQKPPKEGETPLPQPPRDTA